MKRSRCVLLSCSFVALLLAPAMWAQGVQATLRGRVFDKSGAAVPNVQIEVKNTGTNVAVNTTSDSAGLYTAPYLNPGDYTITATASGFKTFIPVQLI